MWSSLVFSAKAENLRAFQIRHVVVVALGVHPAVKSGIVEWTGGAQIDGAADAAFERRSLRRFQDVGARDHFRGQHVERQIATVVIGGENSVVESRDVVLGSQAAHIHVDSLAAGGAADGDAGQMFQRVGDVGVGESTEFFGIDRIQDDCGVPLDLERFLEAGAHAGHDDFLQLRGTAGGGRGGG